MAILSTVDVALTVPQSNQSFHGLVQRLVQKEKHVLQLQTELDRLKASNPAEGKEPVRIQ